MSIESVLADIVGVPCGNVRFTLEAPSYEGLGDYVHGTLRSYVEFTTTVVLPEEKYGSLFIVSSYTKQYVAALLKGEETSRIARAVAESLRCE